MGEIVLKDVCKRYPNGFEAVVNLNLTIGDGEFLVIVGPSGCGKTTALRMVAGLEDITSGTISIGGRVVNGVKPKDRDIAMVFQDYALYPQMTVYQNMAFGLKMRRMPKQEIDRIIRDVAATLGLEAMLDRKPGQLSGGQRQRVAMGRAIARRPTAFLMDEPLSNLDAKLRVQMRAEIARIQHELNVTTLYVTHDQVEAVTLGDRVAVLRDGVLQQVDRPIVLYDRPISTFVASFIGSPTINLMYGRLSRGEAGMELELGDDRLRLPDSAVAEFHALERYEGAEVVVGVRAEDLHDVVAESDWPHDQRLTGEVALVEDLGAELLVHMDVNSRNAADADVDPDAREGQIREDVTRVVARMGKDSRPRQGGRFEVGVDCSRLHLFDPVSFRSLRGSEVGVDAIGA